MVAIGVPLKSTVEAVSKLVPVSVMVVLPAPAATNVGLMLVSVGTGWLTVKNWTPPPPPTGAGLSTTTEKEPGLVRPAAGMTAVSEVELT